MKRRTFLTGASALGLPIVASQVAAAGPTASDRDAGNVRRFGAIGDGTTDDSAAIQRAVNASTVVYFPAGDYLVRKKVDLRNGSSLVGDGAATLRTDGTSYILSAVGRIGARRPLRKNVRRADTSIAVANGTVNTFRDAGGYFLQSDKPPLGHLTHRAGELGSVDSVSQNAVRVSGATLADYQVADNAMAAPITFVDGISIRGLRLRNDNYSSDPTRVTSALIYLEFVSNFRVTDCSLVQNNSAGIAVFSCVNGSIANNHIGKLRDGRKGILGYGVQVGFSSQSITISANNFFECRHAVTTGTGTKSGRTPNYGVSRGLAIVGNTVSNCTNSGLDTHEDSDGVTISGNTVIACRPVGIHVRSYGNTICGNTISACIGKGIRISKTARETVASGNIIRGIRRASSDGDGIVVDSTAVTVSGNQLSECDRHGISVERNAARDISISGNTCRNNGQSGAGDGINVNRQGSISALTVVGNTCTDDQPKRSGRSPFRIAPGTRVSEHDSLIANNNFSSSVVNLSGSSSAHSVAGASLLTISVRGTVNRFTDGVVGQTIKAIANNTVTIANSSNVRLRRGENLVMQRGDTLELTMFEDQVWQETGRSTG